MSRGPQIDPAGAADTEIDVLPSLFLPVPGLRLKTKENEGLDRGRPSCHISLFAPSRISWMSVQQWAPCDMSFQ